MPDQEQGDGSGNNATAVKDLQALYSLGDEASESVVQPEEKPARVQPRDPESGQFVSQPANRFLIQAAKSLEMSDEEIAALNPQELRQYIDDSRRAQAAERRENSSQSAIDDAQARAAAARQQRIEQEQLQKKEDEKDPLEGINEEDYTPEYRSVFALLRTLHKEVKELKKFKEQAHQVLTAQNNEATASFARKVDHQLSQLGPDYEPFIGKGRGHKLPADSLELATRNQIIKDAAALAGEGATREDVIDNIPRAAQKRFGRLVGDSGQEPVQRKYQPRQAGVHPQFRVPKQGARENEDLSDEQVAWLNSGVRKPTQRTGAAEPKGREKAINGLTDRMRDLRQSGGNYEEGYETTLDDFLE